jgi:hypothetical protein
VAITSRRWVLTSSQNRRLCRVAYTVIDARMRSKFGARAATFASPTPFRQRNRCPVSCRHGCSTVRRHHCGVAMASISQVRMSKGVGHLSFLHINLQPESLLSFEGRLESEESIQSSSGLHETEKAHIHKFHSVSAPAYIEQHCP